MPPPVFKTSAVLSINRGGESLWSRIVTTGLVNANFSRELRQM
jgi:hypothetical protein